MTVYIVGYGSYSDYAISAVFSTEEKARAYVQARAAELEKLHLNMAGHYIEEYSIQVYNVDNEEEVYVKDLEL